MATRIGELAPHWPDDELRRQLEALAAELAVPTVDVAEAERRWEHAIATLESLSGPPRTRAFWKR